jgi:hypothetical protein
MIAQEISMQRTHDPNQPPVMDDAVRRFAERRGPPDAARPGPIAGPLRLSLSPALQVVAIVATILLVLAALTALMRPTADATTTTPPEAATPAPAPEPAPAVVQAAPIAPTSAPLAVLSAGAQAYAAPDGTLLGDVGGRVVWLYVERWDVSWVRAQVEGAGLVWLPMGALAGNAIDLAAIPCGERCQPGPMTQPTAVWVPPTTKEYIVVNPDGSTDGNPLEVAVYPTMDISQVPTVRP